VSIHDEVAARFSEPIDMARPQGARLLEAFSPKLGGGSDTLIARHSSTGSCWRQIRASRRSASAQCGFAPRKARQWPT
jgi:hypothetical protein